VTNNPRDKLTLALMALMTAFLYADQNLMAPNLTAIATEFGFSPEEKDVKLGGEISVAFFLVGGIVSLWIGRLADRLPRKSLLVAIMIFGELPCAATYFVETYEQLWVLRVLTGIAIGGAPPLLYSLIGDLVPSTKRPAIAGILFTSLGCGILLGQILAGVLGPDFGWRLPFLLVALPNLGLALIFAAVVKEPERELTQTKGPLSSRTLLSPLSVSTNRLLLCQGILGTLPWAMIFVFLNDYLAQDLRFGVAQATLIIAALGGSAILGALLGGIAGNTLYLKSARLLPLSCVLCTVVAPFPLLVLINGVAGVAPTSLGGPLALASLTGLTAAFAGPNLRAILLNVNPSHQRGTMTALLTLADDLGKGLGPAILSLMVITMGRGWAFNFATLCWTACAVVMVKLVWTFPADEVKAHPLIPQELPRPLFEPTQELRFSRSRS